MVDLSGAAGLQSWQLDRVQWSFLAGASVGLHDFTCWWLEWSSSFFCRESYTSRKSTSDDSSWPHNFLLASATQPTNLFRYLSLNSFPCRNICSIDISKIQRLLGALDWEQRFATLAGYGNDMCVISTSVLYFRTNAFTIYGHMHGHHFAKSVCGS